MLTHKLLHAYMLVTSFHVSLFHIFSLLPVEGMVANLQLLIKIPCNVKYLYIIIITIIIIIFIIIINRCNFTWRNSDVFIVDLKLNQLTLL